jgi:hypothetical protein
MAANLSRPTPQVVKSTVGDPSTPPRGIITRQPVSSSPFVRGPPLPAFQPVNFERFITKLRVKFCCVSISFMLS